MKRIIIMLSVLFICFESYGAITVPLETVIKDAHLIVKCKTVVVDSEVKYRVLKTLKGKYARDAFEKPAQEGFVYVSKKAINNTTEPGQELFLFFTRELTRRLAKYPVVALVENGKVTYEDPSPYVSDETVERVFSVETFEKLVTEVVTRGRPAVSDDTLKRWLSKSDLVVAGKIIHLPKGALTDAIGDARYFATVRVLDVCKGDVKLKGNPIKVTILRFELEDKDRHPLVKRDAECILFLKSIGKRWITVESGFGVQHPTPALVKSLKRLSGQEE